MSVRVSLAILALSLSNPAMAANLNIEEPSAQDESQIDTIISSTISGLKANQAKKAINDFFTTSLLMRSKQTEIDMFSTQTEGTLAIYGKIIDCQLIDKVNISRFAQTRLYICQHERFLTRWIFDMIKTGKGWEAGNLRFDDKYKQGLDQ